MNNFKEVLFLLGILLHSNVECTKQFNGQRVYFDYSKLNDSLHDESESEDYNVKEADEDHRLTLRIPKSLLARIDIKRKQRIGKISRNLWILEALDRATKR